MHILVTTCKRCISKLQIFEDIASRAGLATKLKLHFNDEACLSHKEQTLFFYDRKKVSMHKINKRLVLVGRIAGKGRSGMSEKCPPG